MEKFTADEKGEEFPCIVCSLSTNSIDELHNHQKYRHTTEELSLSVIYLVQYMCLKNKASWLNVTLENCSLGLEKNEKSKSDHFCDQTDCNEPNAYGNDRRGDANTEFIPSWETELTKVAEISEETFLNSVNGICRDLKVIKKPATIGSKGPLKPGEKKKGTNNKNKRVHTQGQNPTRKNVMLPLRQTKMKGLQRSETCTKSPELTQVDKAIDYSMAHDRHTCESPGKLASFSRAFHFLDKKETTESRGNGNSSQSSDQALPHQGIPTLENALNEFQPTQNLGEMPVLEPHLYINELLQRNTRFEIENDNKVPEIITVNIFNA